MGVVEAAFVADAVIVDQIRPSAPVVSPATEGRGGGEYSQNKNQSDGNDGRRFSREERGTREERRRSEKGRSQKAAGHKNAHDANDTKKGQNYAEADPPRAAGAGEKGRRQSQGDDGQRDRVRHQRLLKIKKSLSRQGESAQAGLEFRIGRIGKRKAVI